MRIQDKALRFNILEGTTAANLPSHKGGDKGCYSEKDGDTFMDNGTVYDKLLKADSWRRQTASPQTKTYISGGTDARPTRRAGRDHAAISAQSDIFIPLIGGV